MGARHPAWPGGLATHARTSVRKLEASHLAGVQRATAARVAIQSLPATHAAHRAQAGADERVAQALAALQRAARTLRPQQTPRPGEMQHLANGHSRLTSAYFDRINALETAVAEARAAWRTAYAARDSLVP